MDDRTLYLSLVCVVVMASLGESGTLAGLWVRVRVWVGFLRVPIASRDGLCGWVQRWRPACCC